MVDLSATGNEQLQITKSIIFQITARLVKTQIVEERLKETEQKQKEVKEAYDKLERISNGFIQQQDSMFLYSIDKEVELLKWVLLFH